MKQSYVCYVVSGLLWCSLFMVAGCAGSAPTSSSIANSASEPVAEMKQEQVAVVAAKEAPPASSDASVEAKIPVSQSDRPTQIMVNRMIIKNAELELLVKDTDTTINRTLGIVTDYQAYIISNRTWAEGEAKYATITMGVPVENFEAMLLRLKGLAITVTNETASGQDVTDQYVDSESRLRNLEATAARIRQFLEQTKNVKEALDINQQLTEVEGQIEQVKGQMNALRDRSAYSTITLQLKPELLLPTPTPTMTLTPTPTPTVWSPNQTFTQATEVSSTIGRTLFQTGIDLLIWLVVVILPFSLPFLLGAWLIWRLTRRMRN